MEDPDGEKNSITGVELLIKQTERKTRIKGVAWWFCGVRVRIKITIVGTRMRSKDYFKSRFSVSL